MKRLLKVLVPILLISAGSLGAWLIIQNGREARESQAPAKRATAPRVRVETIERTDVRVVVRSQGTVRPRTESTLVAEIAGKVIWKSPSFAAGEFFREGETLLKLDPREYELARTQAEAEIERAELELTRQKEQAAIARREWNDLGEGEPTPLALRQPQVDQAEASLRAARAAVDQAELNLERTEIEAPYDGRIREIQVDVGQFVNRGTPLAAVFAVDYAEVRLPIPDNQTVFLNLPLSYEDAGSRADGPPLDLIATFQGRQYRFTARLVRTEGELDPETHVIHAIARVDDPYRRRQGRPPLSVGMFVEAEIEGKRFRDVMDVPRAAFIGEDQVMVVDVEDRLRIRQVEVLREQADRAIVTEGLKEGERVVVSPLEMPVDGMRVRIAGDS